MQEMILEYQESRRQLAGRIRELNMTLSEGRQIGTMEAEMLTARRSLLMRENADLQAAICQMQQHPTGKGCPA